MSLSLASNSLSLVSLLLFDRNLDVKILESLHLPLYSARVHWYSYVALFSHRMFKTAITVPILLLVLLPSAANLSLIFDPSFFMASLTSGIAIEYCKTSRKLLRAPSACLACIYLEPKKINYSVNYYACHSSIHYKLNTTNQNKLK